jgi:uncharacterized membrane protein
MDVLAANLGEIAKWLVIAGIVLVVVGSVIQATVKGPRGLDTKSFWTIMAEALRRQFLLAFKAETPPGIRLLAIGFILIELGIIAAVAGLGAAALAGGEGGGGGPTPTPTPTAT